MVHCRGMGERMPDGVQKKGVGSNCLAGESLCDDLWKSYILKLDSEKYIRGHGGNIRWKKPEF